MEDLKPGDVISVVTEIRDEAVQKNRFSKKTYKYVVVKLYEHYVLCKRIGTEIRECFTWWDLKTNMVKRGRV